MPLFDMLYTIVEDSPGCTRLMAVSVIMLTLFTSVLPLLNVVAPPCSVPIVVDAGYVWAIPTSFLRETSQTRQAIIFFALEIIWAMALFSPWERTLGSTSFLLWLVSMVSVINIAFLVLVFTLMQAVSPEYAMERCQGLWPLMGALIVQKYMTRPEDMLSPHLQIRNKFVPVCWLGLNILLAGKVPWDVVAGVLVGYGHDMLGIDAFVQRQRTKQVLARLTGGRGCNSILGGKWLAPGEGRSQPDVERGSYGRPQQRPMQQDTTPKFQAFQGPGHTLGRV